MALGRENNSLEFWACQNEDWTQLLLLEGIKNCDIRNLHWVLDWDTDSTSSQEENYFYYLPEKGGKEKKRRIVSTGLNGAIVEWDLVSRQPRSKYQV
jgi:hypothetical protein